VLDALHGLVRRNMVQRTGSRFSLLASIRDFADRQLSDAERRAAHARHAAFVGERARTISRDGVAELAVVRELEELVPELEAISARGAVEPAVGSVPAATALALLYERRSTPSAVLRVTERGLALPRRPDDEEDRALLHKLHAFALRRSGDHAGAMAEFAEQLEEPLTDAMRATVLANLADLHTDRGEAAEADERYREALELALVHGPAGVAACTAIELSVNHALRGEVELADRYRGIAYGQLPRADRFSELEVRKADGWLAIRQERLDDARAHYLRVAQLAEDLRSLRAQAIANGQIGIVAEAQDHLDEADQRYARAFELLTQLGDPVYVGYYDGYRGRVELRLGRVDQGIERLQRSLTVEGMDPSVRRGLVNALALARARRGDPEPAPPPSERLRPTVRALGRAAAAAADGRRAEAQQALADLRATLPISDLHEHLLVTHYLRELDDDVGAWRISADGARVETPDGATLDLSRHQANARILAHLAQRRAEAPGTPADAKGLAAAGWPGERIVASAASNRVRVALSTLRREGLADLIERVDGGWRLRVDVPIVRTSLTSS
jgi:tetratricopeptide (TPR) repeat protein